MKWGIRRYQNQNGTLTSEGKRRYNSYKSKQLDLASGKLSKAQIKLKKRKDKGKSTERAEKRVAYAKELVKRTKNMSVDDMDREQAAVAKNYVFSAGLTLASFAAPGPAFIVFPDSQNAREIERMRSYVQRR